MRCRYKTLCAVPVEEGRLRRGRDEKECSNKSNKREIPVKGSGEETWATFPQHPYPSPPPSPPLSGSVCPRTAMSTAVMPPTRCRVCLSQRASGSGISDSLRIHYGFNFRVKGVCKKKNGVTKGTQQQRKYPVLGCWAASPHLLPSLSPLLFPPT